ncbi:MAG: hypothetical protein ACREB9_01720 [Thermoplasmata archaeon]
MPSNLPIWVETNASSLTLSSTSTYSFTVTKAKNVQGTPIAFYASQAYSSTATGTTLGEPTISGQTVTFVPEGTAAAGPLDIGTVTIVYNGT